jgi:hypothetical protein
MELYALSAELVLNKLAAIRGNRSYSWVLTRAKDVAAGNTRSPLGKCGPRRSLGSVVDSLASGQLIGLDGLLCHADEFAQSQAQSRRQFVCDFYSDANLTQFD